MSVLQKVRHWWNRPGEDARRRTVRNAVGCGAAVTLTAIVGSLATEPDGGWYSTLEKPSSQPPRAAFPIAWTLLYADIAVTSTLVLDELGRRGDNANARRYRVALGTNLALNAGWCWLFFRGRNLPASTIAAAILATSSTQLAARAGAVRGRYGAALGAYAAWTTFATALSGAVWQLNAD